MAGPAIATMLHFSLRMTIDAPRHAHSRNPSDAIHRLHRTVTFLALEACLDVALVCKVHVVRNVVNFNPRYRLLIFPVSGQLEDLRVVADTGYRFMAAHAFANAGYAGNRRLIGIDMTVLARNFVDRGVCRVTELYGLNGAAIGEIFAVYPRANKKTKHEHQPKQSWLFCRLQRIRYRDRQNVSPLLGQEFARMRYKLQISIAPRQRLRYVKSRFDRVEVRRNES